MKALPYLLLIAILGFACKSEKKQATTRSIYYWHSVYKPTPFEAALADSLHLTAMNMRFFDVDWDDARREAVPVAPVRIENSFAKGRELIPVAFITNETLVNIADSALPGLAQKMMRLIESTVRKNRLPTPSEIQIDCDWTTGTRDKYFTLLLRIRQHPFLKGKTLSATIRLHQIKFRAESGVPPVDRGLLMAYNMGNLRDPATRNSILDPEELEKYLRYAGDYPLPLDAALPLFDWWVWFRGGEYYGLIHGYRLQGMPKGEKRISFDVDSTVQGFAFAAGDWLRYEASGIEDLQRAADALQKALPAASRRIVLYHLDEQNLRPYPTHELENLYRSFE